MKTLLPPNLVMKIIVSFFALFSACLGFLIILNFIDRRMFASNSSQDGRNDDRCAKNNKQKPKNLFHDISPKTFIQCEKYVTHDVTTQAFCLWLTTFNPHFSGSTTK
jgi:hypothetical protein